jgi:anthranilate phosphoribosyltransferase
MIQDGIRLAAEGENLTAGMTKAIMDEMMAGAATPSQMAAFLTAMRIKGETKDELLGLVRGMREKARKISAPSGAIDLCGTGGDGAKTFNISTTASFVVAACGVPVAKHGNRAMSSRSGSADVLTALGVPVALDQRAVERCMRETGIGFMFAPKFHESMRNVMATRRDIGIRTFFNILGPMANPASVKRQLIGVYDAGLTRTVAEVLRDLGSERAMVVHGSGLDEISGSDLTKVVELRDGELREYDIGPGDFGLDPCDPRDVAGGSAEDNARTMLTIMSGERSSRTDVVAMNSAAALVVAGRASTLAEGFETASEAIIGGAAMEKLRTFSDRCCELETEAQLGMPASELIDRRILSEVLRSRYAELSANLVTRVSEMDGGERHLEGLDKGLIENPSILTVLCMNRMSKVLSEATDTLTASTRRPEAAFSKAIVGATGLAVIGEYKPRSPSTVGLNVAPDALRVAGAYSDAGVACMSVLAEEDFFGGGEEVFARVRGHTTLPMLFKDFVVTERQIDRARSLGADAVLLIAKALTVETLAGFVDIIRTKGMEPLVEVHDELDLEKVDSCSNNASIGMIGVNGRNLRTLEVSVERVKELRSLIGDDRTVIAESGMVHPRDVEAMRGFDGVLIGSMFMKAGHIEATVRETVDIATGVAK